MSLNKYIFKYILIFFCCFFSCGCIYTEKVDIDPFQNCEVSVTGWNGSGKINISCNIEYFGNDETVSKLLDSISYSVENNGNLSNGDVVNIELEYAQHLYNLCDISFTRESYKYTVNELLDNDKDLLVYENTFIDEDSGEEVSVYTETYMIDGIEIPASWNLTEEEQRAYVKYAKNIGGNNVTEDDANGYAWLVGNSSTKTHRVSTKYLTEDYNNSRDCYQAAFEFGNTSSQEFMIVPIMKQGVNIGYKCEFKE